MFDDWSAIEAAQAQADAEDARRGQQKAESSSNATPEPVADPEAAAAVEEAGNIAWPHPIRPTTVFGPQPTNADGSHRDGSWRSGNPPTWQDRPKVDPVTGIRLYAKLLREMFRGDLDDHD